MKGEVKLAIKKLNKKFPNFEITTKNVVVIDTDDCIATVQLTVFESQYLETLLSSNGSDKVIREHRSIVVKKVDGVGKSKDRIEAISLAIINCVNTVGIF